MLAAARQRLRQEDDHSLLARIRNPPVEDDALPSPVFAGAPPPPLTRHDGVDN